MINVVIADDQALIRDSLKIVLSMDEEIKVVGTAANGLEVLDLLKKNMWMSSLWIFECQKWMVFWRRVWSKKTIQKQK